MFQFSLRALLVTAVVVAVGCAALIHPTEVWRQAVVTMTVVILLFSTLASHLPPAAFGPLLAICRGRVAVLLLAFVPAFNVETTC